MKSSLLLLGELTDADMQWLLQVGKSICIPATGILVHENKPIEELYLLLDGILMVETRLKTESNRQRAIARLNSGEIIGEMSFVDFRPPSATVRAETDALVFAIDRQLLMARAEEDAEFGRRFYRGLAYCLSNRLRLMNVSLPQAGIEISGAAPPALENPIVAAHRPIAQQHLEELIASQQTLSTQAARSA